MEEDPTAFQYDEVYEKMEKEKSTKVVETKKAKEERKVMDVIKFFPNVWKETKSFLAEIRPKFVKSRRKTTTGV